MRTLSALDAGELRTLLDREEFFWLDLVHPTTAEVDQLAQLLGWHPLAVEDTTKFGQRPKVDAYEDHMLLVHYGARLDADREPVLIEVHLYVSGDYVVTVRRDDAPLLERVPREIDEARDPSEEFAVYRILDALTDSLLATVLEIGQEIGELERDTFEKPRGTARRRIPELKSAAGRLRPIVMAQRDSFMRAIDALAQLTGLQRGARNYFRDVEDHMQRAADEVEGFRYALDTITDLYLSSITERLTLVATIFLPLTVVTGFFGQNFGWMVDHIDSLAAFLIFGVGGIVISALAIWIWLRRNDLT